MVIVNQQQISKIYNLSKQQVQASREQVSAEYFNYLLFVTPFWRDQFNQTFYLQVRFLDCFFEVGHVPTNPKVIMFIAQNANTSRRQELQDESNNFLIVCLSVNQFTTQYHVKFISQTLQLAPIPTHKRKMSQSLSIDAYCWLSQFLNNLLIIILKADIFSSHFTCQNTQQSMTTPHFNDLLSLKDIGLYFQIFKHVQSTFPKFKPALVNSRYDIFVVG